MKKLGDISQINYGYTAKASFDQVGLKFLRITDIQNDSVNWADVPYCTIDQSNIQKYQEFRDLFRKTHDGITFLDLLELT
jgi:type I restriction enzyme S subunit